MHNQCRLAWIAIVLVLLALSVDRAHATEAQAAFALKNGWVEVALRKDGRPVANAVIVIIDHNGKEFGDGETDGEGRAAFPLPPGAFFVVEIKAGEKTADPIRLMKMDSTVEPARVLLSYGLRPCCRSIKSASESTPAGEQAERLPATDEVPVLVPVFAGISIIAVVLLMIFYR